MRHETVLEGLFDLYTEGNCMLKTKSVKTTIRKNDYILGIEPTLDGGHSVFAHNDLFVGGGGHVDAHLAEEIGGEFLHGDGADDELTVDAHKALGVELAFNFFEGHVQGVVLAFQSAEAHHAIADGDMAHVADGDNQELVGTMGDEEAFTIADGMALDRLQQLGDGVGCRKAIDH